VRRRGRGQGGPALRAEAIGISERLVAHRLESMTAALGVTSHARVFLSGLLNNTTGVIFAFGAFLHGATLVVPQGRDLATWPAQVEPSRATHVMLRPVALRRFVDAAAGADLSSLRVVAYGAAAMPRGTLEAGRALMPCEWVHGYGLSETYGPFCWLDEAAHRAGRPRRGAYNVGRPDSTVQLRLGPVPGHPDGIGEVLVGGDTLMNGYLDVTTGAIAPPWTWLRTGDLDVTEGALALADGSGTVRPTGWCCHRSRTVRCPASCSATASTR
jgi:acyl-CoA synthetase (AMP-forming)/AMP-acid ligase II